MTAGARYLRLTIIASLAGLLFGFDTAVISGVTQALREVFRLSPTSLGIAVSSALWGTLCGALVAGRLGDRFGSRDMLKIVGLFYLLSAIGCSMAWSLDSFIVFRVVGGLAVGASSVLAPVYISELAPAQRRGALVGLFQFNIVLGILIAYLSNYLLGIVIGGADAWRWKLASGSVPSGIFLVLLFFIPHSPRWLVVKQRLAEATAVLRGLDVTDADEQVRAYREAGVAAGAVRTLSWRLHRRPILLAIGLALFNQLSGINAILYYLNDIFRAAGFSSTSSDLQAVAVGAANFVATIAALSLIDRVGRKVLLLIGAVGTALTLAGVAVIMATGIGRAWLLSLLILFIASFAFSQGAVIWVYLSEIFPSEVRARGQGVGSATHWLANAVISRYFPLVAAVTTALPFAFFASCMALQFVVVWWLFPETKRATLETLSVALEAGTPAAASHRWRASWLPAVLLALLAGGPIFGAEPGTSGPYNLTLLQGGIGMSRTLPADTPLLRAGAAWSVTSWVRVDVPQAGSVVLAAIGDDDSATRLTLEDGRPAVRVGAATQLQVSAPLQADAPLPAGQWHFVAATFDGRQARLYVDGISRASADLSTPSSKPLLELAPVIGWPTHVQHFGGSLGQFQLHGEQLSAQAISALAATPPAFDVITFTDVGVGWPVQVKAWIGLTVPQDPWTLPHAKAPPTAAVAVPPAITPALRPASDGAWLLGGWRLRAAPGLAAGGAVLSEPGFVDRDWYVATVPGTVLTTLIDRGVYPDPDYGLNNLAIPESLARQDYWYRTEFAAPATLRDRRLTLDFEGINYSAEVWLNGQRLGDVRGAFIRGVFDVTHLVHVGQPNALAVRISPPPHPGIPSEESIAYGPGENGGSMAIDGPTFFDTEGWDWIPGIRDRDSGLWQDVRLEASGAVRILDPDVVTHLPLPKTDQASLMIRVPLDNAGTARDLDVEAAFEGVTVVKHAHVPAGQSEVRLEPAEFPQLTLHHPRLWWPNGYGEPALYTLHVTVRDGGRVSATRQIRFGIRELTYELSLFDHTGRLRRVEIDPALASTRGERLVDVRHSAIKQVDNGWAESLTPDGERSAAVHDVATQSLSPFLVIRCNGTPIAARGGSWGMDDSRKRSSRERLEPYFRLHREAHLNIIRNWLGQNTEQTFYDLADEYGLLVLNDFWESTQNFQLEAQDPALFLANARDSILRYRHHPSIAIWFGRNEGVPQPIINEGLDELVATLDGTRWYTGSSNRVNLQDSGPYNYRPPIGYFTDLARGFAVEVGTPSLATLESIEASIPEPDRWPLSDTIAYHDWHFGGNGDVASFMQALDTQFGDAASLDDFERKAQMMNYVDYRAVFEGFLAHLWTQNSGRLLWMTHPAWPSNHWQIYSSDYDTHASYYGVKKANEPLHVQMNLGDYALAVANTTREDRPHLTVVSRIVTLDGRILATREDHLDAPANQVVTLPALAIARYLARDGVEFVALKLIDAAGTVLSENLYWPSRDESALRALSALKPQPVQLGLGGGTLLEGGEHVLRITLENTGSAPALNAKLTLVDTAGQRILPAYYSDNYLSLLPHEPRAVEIRYSGAHSGEPHVQLRGWNVQPTETPAGAH